MDDGVLENLREYSLSNSLFWVSYLMTRYILLC